MEIEFDHSLPKNIYSLPELKEDGPMCEKHEESKGEVNNPKKMAKKNWGHVVVEKSPSRRSQDERTMLEKAQDMKKVVNL
jgi:hypothetical protein